MMPFAGHAGLSLITSLLTGFNPLLVLIGSVIPDLDSVVSFFGVSFNKVHRKITHSLLFLIMLLLSSIFVPLLLPIAIGVIIHLVADLDHCGVSLLYPFSKKRYSVLKINNKNEYDSVTKCLKAFFKQHYLKFVAEVALLVTGLMLSWGYWASLFNNLFV